MTVATASTKAGTNTSDSSTQAAWPASMSWTVAPGIRRASVELARRRDHPVVVGDDDRGRDVDPGQPRAGVVPAERGHGLADRPRAGAAELARAPSRGCRRASRSRRLGGRARRAHRRTRPGDAAGAEHGELHALVEHPLRRRPPEPVGRRAQHQPGDLRPGAGARPAARRSSPSRSRRRSPARARARPAARPRRRRSRRARTPRTGCRGRASAGRWSRPGTAPSSGPIDGNQVSRPVQPTACSSSTVGESGCGPGVSVTYVDAAARELDHPSLGDRHPGHVDRPAGQSAHGQEGHGAPSRLD